MPLKITLKPDLPFLSISELVQKASVIDGLASRISSRITKLQEEIKRIQDNLVSRFKDNPEIRRQIERQIREGRIGPEIQTFIDQGKAELDAIFKEAGRLALEVDDQKPFYDSPVKMATRLIGDSKRLSYLQDLEHVGALALANLAQLAVSTKNKALGSAIIERLAAMPTDKKPVKAGELARAVFSEEWERVLEVFRIVENRFQQIQILYRSFQQQRIQPVQRVELGLNKQGETGVLDQLIADEQSGSAG